MTLIAVKTPYEEVMAYFNNDAPEAMHYQEGLLNEYVKGGMAKLVISGLNNHEDCQYLVEGNKLAFRFEDKDYDLSIVTVFKNERNFEITAISNSFELLFETYGEYSGKSMSFEQYFNVFKAESAVTIGINEVSEKRISNEWTGKQTLYARLFSLAEVFGAEIEFVTKLNDDYSLQSITANVYKEYADGVQGIGQNRTDLTFKYGKDVTTIGKTSDINDLYTAIKAYGKDGLSINDIEREWLDADGNVEYFTRKGQPRIYAPQARDRFPSTTFSSQSERYIGFDAESTEYSTAEALCGYMLSELKKNCVPKVTYDIEGDFDVNVGDTVIMEDDGYKPTLYLEVRAGETEKSLVNKRHRKMVVSNVKELASEIDASLLDRVQALIDANKTYQYSISTDNGIVFKNNTGTTTLTANVKNGVSDLTSEFNIAWFKDGVAVGTGVSITVQATEIVEKAVYRFEASRDGNVVGGYEVTVSDVTDGEEGFSPIVTPNDNGTITIVDKEGEKTTPDLTGPQGPPGEVDQELIDEITNAAEDAKKAGEEAQAAAEQAEADSALAVENANNAVNKANEASAKADQSSAAAAQAQSDATTAMESATQAFDDAKDALDGVDGLRTDLTTEVTRIDGVLVTKVSQTDFNGLEGTVSAHSTQISQNTTDIKLKASITEVNALSGRVSSTESQLTVQAGTISALNTLTDGHTAQIGNLTASFDGLSSTVSKVQTDLAGKASLTEFSNLSQTVSVIQGTVANKAEQSQVTQLAGQITSIVSDVSNIKAVGTNLWAPSYYASNQYYIDASGSTVANTTYLSTNHILVGSNKSVMVSVFEYTGATTGRIVVAFYNGTTFISRSQINPNTTTESQVTFPASTTRIAFSAPIAGRYKFEFGVKATDYSVSPLDTATTSQITQLADRMNFRITNSDGSITQIDLANKVISLSGEQVNITGNTYIENGVIKTAAIADAAITNAKIGSLSADKVTVGTLNGANVNIINLNASNIVSGQITGIDILASTFHGTSVDGTMQLNGTDLRFDTTDNSFRLNYTGIKNSNTAYGNRTIGFYDEGIYIRADANNSSFGSPDYLNAGLELYGSMSYIDFHNAPDDTSDYKARIIYNMTGQENNLFIKSNGGLVMESGAAGINVGTNVIFRTNGTVQAKSTDQQTWRSFEGASFSQQSAYSLKTDFEPMDTAAALKAITDTDIVKYHLIDELQRGNAEDYVSFIINDNGLSPYSVNPLLVNKDNASFNTTTVVGVLMAAIKELNNKIQKLEAA